MKLHSAAKISVVIPANATTREQFATVELCKYLAKILPGICVNTCTDTQKVEGNKILIGGPEHNKATAQYISEEEFDRVVPGPEGMMIKAFGEDTLVIAGSSKNPNERERGTIYGVYELLERYAGCCFGAFFNPDYAGGEYIPALEELDLTDVEYVKDRADNMTRGAVPQYSHGIRNDDLILHRLNIPFYDWLIKNRYNTLSFWHGIYQCLKENGMIEELERRGFNIGVGSHAFLRTMLPPFGNDYFPEHYRETHPEFFRLEEDGTRFNKWDNFWGQWTLCSRNQELLDTMAKNIISWLDRNPAVRRLGIAPQDGVAPQCVCPECSKYTKTENYIYFVNEVIKRVRKVYPDVMFGTSAYTDLWDCPDGLKMEENVSTTEAVWHSTGMCSVGKPDGSCINGTFFEKALLKWKDAGAITSYYHYYMGCYPARQRYMPAADEMQALHRRCNEVGISGISTQVECYNFWNNVFNFYCLSRVGYDNELTMQMQLEKFSAIFGEGAPYIQEIITHAEDVLDGQASVMQAGLYLMEHIDKERVYDLYDKALAAATTPEARNNIRLMRMEFRYSDLECSVTDMLDDTNYKQYETCPDPTGELYYMSHNFDSKKYNNPGLGIMFPLDCEKQVEFVPDQWYTFEK